MSLWNSGPSLKSLLASRLSPAFIWIERRTPLPPRDSTARWYFLRKLEEKIHPYLFPALVGSQHSWIVSGSLQPLLCGDTASSGDCLWGSRPRYISNISICMIFFLSCKATFTGSKNYSLRILFLCLFLFRLKKYLCSLYGRQPRLVWSGICIMTFIFLWFPAICIHMTFLFPYPTENILASISKM